LPPLSVRRVFTTSHHTCFRGLRRLETLRHLGHNRSHTVSAATPPPAGPAAGTRLAANVQLALLLVGSFFSASRPTRISHQVLISLPVCSHVPSGSGAVSPDVHGAASPLHREVPPSNPQTATHGERAFVHVHHRYGMVYIFNGIEHLVCTWLTHFISPTSHCR